MWQRLRDWLGQTQPPSSNDEAAPRIEPGLDSPLIATDFSQPALEPTLTELGDAYESAFAGDAVAPGQATGLANDLTHATLEATLQATPMSNSPVVDLPLTLPRLAQPDHVAADALANAAWNLAPPTQDADVRMGTASPATVAPQAPLAPDEAMVLPPSSAAQTLATDAPAADLPSPAEPTASASVPNRQWVEPRMAPDAFAAPHAPAAAHVAQSMEPRWHDTTLPSAPATAAVATATATVTREEPQLDAHSAPTLWADSRLEPVLVTHASTSASALAPATASLPAASGNASTPSDLAVHAANTPAALAPTPAPSNAPPTEVPTAKAPELQAPVQPQPAAPPPARDNEPVLVHVFATLREPIPPHFACVSQQQLAAGSAEMTTHMQGLMQYVQGRVPAEMTQRRHGLWRHLQRVHHMWRLSVMPDQLDALGQWAAALNAVIALPDGSVRDTKGYVLLAGPGGRDDDLARLPHPPDAWQRKQATEARLLEHGWLTPSSLPPVAGEGEVDLRPAAEVMGRALALLLVAVRAESLSEGAPEALTADRLYQKLPSAFAHLTPQELQFVNTDAPIQAHVVAMEWRYEALNVLLWALGLVDELIWPDALCDMAHCVSVLVGVDADALVANATLRPSTDIIDQLDLHLRLHWLLRDAELQGHTKPALRRGVLMERHHALNWLIGYEQASWDKVSTRI